MYTLNVKGDIQYQNDQTTLAADAKFSCEWSKPALTDLFIRDCQTPFLCTSLVTRLHLKLFLSPARRCRSVTVAKQHISSSPSHHHPLTVVPKQKHSVPGQTSPAGMRAYDVSRYRQSAEPPQPPSSQGDSYSQVPKTHRVMTLADHISVRCGSEYETVMKQIPNLNCPSYLITWFFGSVLQHIITQDFARNQEPPPVSSSASATFQSVVPPVSSSGRAKGPSRYSPENQVQALHHQRPSSRVSPENAPEKPRARYMDQRVNPHIMKVSLLYDASCV